MKDIPENFPVYGKRSPRLVQKYYNVLNNHIDIFHPSCRFRTFVQH